MTCLQVLQSIKPTLDLFDFVILWQTLYSPILFIILNCSVIEFSLFLCCLSNLFLSILVDRILLLFFLFLIFYLFIIP